MQTKYLLSYDDLNHQTFREINKILNSKKYTMGNMVERFERKLSSWLGVKNAIMVNSGSSANLLLITSLLYRSKKKKILKKGDEILVPALSWPTTVWPIVQLGFRPVFVDINLDTLAIDLNSAKKNINKKTKAMFLIHVMGMACDMDKYSKFCKINNLILLEDCCESFGAFFKTKTVGSFGYAGTISHYFSHHLTTIEGGTIITNNDDLANDLKSLRSHGWIRERSDKIHFKKKHNKQLDERWVFLLPGYNVRPTEIQAMIGLNQLKQIEKKLIKREKVVLKVHNILKNCKSLEIIGINLISKNKIAKNLRRHSWMNIPIIVNSSRFDAYKVKQIFEKNFVETRPIISGNILKHPVLKLIDFKKSTNLNNVNKIHKFGFLIGCHSSITNKQISLINKVVKKINLLDA